MEHFPSVFNKDTAFTEDKGLLMGFCLRSEKSPTSPYIDDNTLAFVVLHELAHVASSGYGHDPEFWRNFKYVLTQAVRCGLYTPVDYGSNPVTYCGMRVTYSPLHDPTL
jgi:hypothetical protein